MAGHLGQHKNRLVGEKANVDDNCTEYGFQELFGASPSSFDNVDWDSLGLSPVPDFSIPHDEAVVEDPSTAAASWHLSDALTNEGTMPDAAGLDPNLKVGNDCPVDLFYDNLVSSLCVQPGPNAERVRSEPQGIMPIISLDSAHSRANEIPAALPTLPSQPTLRHQAVQGLGISDWKPPSATLQTRLAGKPYELGIAPNIKATHGICRASAARAYDGDRIGIGQGTRCVSKQPQPRSIFKTNKSNTKRKHYHFLQATHEGEPSARLTIPNPHYSPHPLYTPTPRPQPWSIYSYSEDGELDPSRLYTAAEITSYLFDHRLHASLEHERRQSQLTIRVHRNPPWSKSRYPTSHSHRCRFQECPASNGTINQGHTAVAFDELSSTYPKHDPFLVAGYVHLYCLERFCSFPEICRTLNVSADTRRLKNENFVKNPMSFGTSAETRCVSDFIQACQRDIAPAWYSLHYSDPVFPFEHNGTLTYMLACTKLRKEPCGYGKQREARAQIAGYQGSTLETHFGDLELEMEIRSETRKHKNQNQLKVPRARRVYRRKAWDGQKSEDETDEEDGDNNAKDFVQAPAPVLRQTRAPVANMVSPLQYPVFPPPMSHPLGPTARFSVPMQPSTWKPIPAPSQALQWGKKRTIDDFGEANEPPKKQIRTFESGSQPTPRAPPYQAPMACMQAPTYQQPGQLAQSWWRPIQ
ncbi:hypothetical protein MMC21_002385 [Puttea exsequens]|nr:hypothetical protein [Puttea exsequens]